MGLRYQDHKKLCWVIDHLVHLYLVIVITILLVIAMGWSP